MSTIRIRFRFKSSRIPLKDSRSQATMKGLSLLEVMVAVVLISILAGMASISLQPLWKKHTLNKASKSLAGQIQLLRLRSILEDRTYQAKIAGSHFMFRAKEGNSWNEWQQKTLPYAVQFKHSGSLYFYSKGFASPKTITLGSEAFKKTVVININGRVRESEIFQ